jgi:Flp pilus assembly protein TadD
MMDTKRIVLLSVLLLMLAVAAMADQAYDYCKSGIEKGDKGNILGALSDFDQAVRLRPDYASAYYNRGLVKKMTGDTDGAIVDLTKAVQLNPADAV